MQHRLIVSPAEKRNVNNRPSLPGKVKRNSFLEMAANTLRRKNRTAHPIAAAKREKDSKPSDA